jgi:hypothetical protein
MGAFGRAGAAVDRVVGAIAARLPWESRARRRGWIAVALFMTIAPAAFSAGREARFASSVQVFPRVVGPFPLTQDVRLPRSLLFDPLLRQEVADDTGTGSSLYRHVFITRPVLGSAFTLRVTQPSPEGARKVTDAVALQLAYASGRRVSSDATARAALLRKALTEPGVTEARRAKARRELVQLRALVTNPPNRFVASGRATEPRLTHWADRVADALPGAFPRRTSPFWSGVAGLALAVLLWAVCLRIAPPVRRGPDDPQFGGTDWVRRAFEAPPASATEPAPQLDMRPLTGRQRALWIAALLVMPAILLASIAGNAVNVPFYDEWNGLVPLFQADDRGGLGLGDFWAQHNEHRAFFPRLIQFALAHVTSWDIRVELYLNLAVALATFATLVAVMRRSLDRTALLAASVVASIVFFSPVQWENWLWGWQFGWFLSNIALAGALWALTVTIDRRPRRGLALGAACAVVGSFSLAQGLLIWPAGLAILLLRRRPWAVWAGLSVVVPALYLAGWNGSDAPGASIVDYVRFVLIYLGRTFGVSDATGYLVGAALLVSFLAGAAYVVLNRRDRALVDRAAFWLGIGLFSLGAAAITAIGRAGLGVAAISRYSGTAELFAIATMALLLTILVTGEVAGRIVTAPVMRWGIAALTVPLLLAALVNLRPGFDAMDKRGRELAAIGDCTRTVTVVGDPCLNQPLPGFKDVRVTGIRYLERKGWAGF